MRRRDFARVLAGTASFPLLGVINRRDDWVAAGGQPELSADALGWLAHLDRKVSLGGTWTKRDTVGPQWDTISFQPTMHYARYEPTWLAWSMGLMADTTPAWREKYAKVLGFLADRYLEYWSFWEWLEHRGDDPKRGSYPEAFNRIIPPGYVGRYNLPGWAGNGSRKEPYDPDPIRAGGRFGLMYKGYMNLVLSMYRYVSDDGKYDRPFEVRYDDTLAWTWDHTRLNQLLADQWGQHEEGIACEVSKVYPWCNTLSGAGVRLFDAFHGTRYADAYYRWQRYFAKHYVDNQGASGPEWLTGYHDPDLKVSLNDPGNINGANWVVTTWHGVAVDEKTFRPLYDTLMRRVYRPQADGTAYLSAVGAANVDSNIVTGLGAALAQEMGDTDKAEALRRWIMAKYQPLRDPERGEFAFGFGLNEPWPRGQMNAWVMPALLVSRPGHWRGLFNAPNRAKFQEPTVEGVDFPRARVRTARYDAGTGTLHVALVAGRPADEGSATQFRVTRLAPGARYLVAARGTERTETASAQGITVDTVLGGSVAIRRVG